MFSRFQQLSTWPLCYEFPIFSQKTNISRDIFVSTPDLPEDVRHGLRSLKKPACFTVGRCRFRWMEIHVIKSIAGTHGMETEMGRGNNLHTSEKKTIPSHGTGIFTYTFENGWFLWLNHVGKYTKIPWVPVGVTGAVQFWKGSHEPDPERGLSSSMVVNHISKSWDGPPSCWPFGMWGPDLMILGAVFCGWWFTWDLMESCFFNGGTTPSWKMIRTRWFKVTFWSPSWRSRFAF